MSTLLSVNELSFENEVSQSTLPVLIEFGAEWCGPCVKLLPVLEKFATNNVNLKIVKIDIDDSPTLSSKFKIRAVPTLMLFKDGIEVDSKVGMISASDLQSWIDEKLK